MGTDAPTTVFIPVHCAPKKAPCPKCGKLAGRKRNLPPAWSAPSAYKTIAYLEITCGEYHGPLRLLHDLPQHPRGRAPQGPLRQQGPRPGARSHPQGRHEHRTDLGVAPPRVPPRPLHGVRLRRAPRPRRSNSTWPSIAAWSWRHFSGTLCVDELHLGRFTLLLATDPLRDLPVAFALVAANDQDHMRRFLKNLKNWGLKPQVVVTDGSNLYPAVLAELWPDAEHQLCVFHVIKDINKLILDAVRRMRTAMSRRGKAGRKKKRGRKSPRPRPLRPVAG